MRHSRGRAGARARGALALPKRLSRGIHTPYEHESSPSRTGFTPGTQGGRHEGRDSARSHRAPHTGLHGFMQRRTPYFGHPNGHRDSEDRRRHRRSSGLRERGTGSLGDLPGRAHLRRPRRARSREPAMRRGERSRVLGWSPMRRGGPRRPSRPLRLRAPRVRDSSLYEPRGMPAHHGHGLPDRRCRAVTSEAYLLQSIRVERPSLARRSSGRGAEAPFSTSTTTLSPVATTRFVECATTW